MSSYATVNNLYIIPVSSRVQPQVHQASASQVTLCRLLPRPAVVPLLVQAPAQAPPQRIIPTSRFVMQAPAPQRLFVETQASTLVPTPEPSNTLSTQSSTATFTFANPTPAENSEQRTFQPAISSLPPPNIISDRPTYRGERQVCGSRCYAFAFHKKKKICAAYKCIYCCKEGCHTQVDVIDDDFQEDPCMLAWNRKALSLGLKAEMKNERVLAWWMTIKGLIFLPPHLHRKIPAFFRPPLIGNDHRAYQKCKSFLTYLHKNWYEGPFADIWNKWDKKELRTSNIAEAYHRILRVLIRENNAPVRKTLMCLKGSDNRAMCTLRNMERRIIHHPRKKDLDRRERIERFMEAHRELLLHTPFVSTRDLVEYCQTMAHFVTDKVI